MATSANVRDRGERRNLSVGAVLTRAFAIIGENPLVVLGIAFLFGALPGQLYTLLAGAAGFPVFTAGLPSGPAPILSGMAAGIISFVAGLLAYAALYHAAAAHGRGERAVLSACVRRGLARLLPLTGLSVLMTLGFGVGLLLFLVPGVMLVVMWFVAAPALVEEDIGILAALRRSRQLTKGARWRVFGLLLVLSVLLVMLSAFAAGVAASAGTGADGEANALWAEVSSLVIVTGTTALFGTATGSLYLALRDGTDGPSDATLAEVFA